MGKFLLFVSKWLDLSEAFKDNTQSLPHKICQNDFCSVTIRSAQVKLFQAVPLASFVLAFLEALILTEAVAI